MWTMKVRDKVLPRTENGWQVTRPYGKICDIFCKEKQNENWMAIRCRDEKRMILKGKIGIIK